jgi:hypothetical protein
VKGNEKKRKEKKKDIGTFLHDLTQKKEVSLCSPPLPTCASINK